MDMLSVGCLFSASRLVGPALLSPVDTVSWALCLLRAWLPGFGSSQQETSAQKREAGIYPCVPSFALQWPGRVCFLLRLYFWPGGPFFLL